MQIYSFASIKLYKKSYFPKIEVAMKIEIFIFLKKSYKLQGLNLISNLNASFIVQIVRQLSDPIQDRSHCKQGS
ncbi:hypothetical protein SAMN05421780_101154 [Flexibacter flexilis DSM 6793]|uniref:Uncharacterized protein n=1 Tax=Flexibacter flexilis DSM 6793 TaxID=927664 RepID=A0A1I1DDY1_9BACT|nr:hypothetical protein SAMN05421780_101154 [Flexibacter flexilis DSM 6793]